jgi:hypothetical protein
MLSQIKQYITEMGITDSFYERMVNTEPAGMAVYNSDSFTQLVPENDPLYQEISVAYDARHYGATTSEMRKRLRTLEECRKRQSQDYVVCYDAAHWGLSERVYLERSKRLDECWRDVDSRLLQGLPKKERIDHPIVLKREACERSMMLGF